MLPAVISFNLLQQVRGWDCFTANFSISVNILSKFKTENLFIATQIGIEAAQKFMMEFCPQWCLLFSTRPSKTSSFPSSYVFLNPLK